MISAITYSERPELWAQIEDLETRVWPEYNLHGDVLNRYWGDLYDEFPDFQFVLYDSVHDAVLAEGHTLPCYWSGDPATLPEGIDNVIEDGFGPRATSGSANTLCALAVEIPPENRDRRLSPDVILAMRDIASNVGFGDLIAPLRPNWKERYPITPIERYCEWVRPDGLPFDPWLRVHVRMGAKVLQPAPRSLLITGTVAEWESWTGMSFPETGTYVFPSGLAPLSVDVEGDVCTYWEPNIWVRHEVPPHA